MGDVNWVSVNAGCWYLVNEITKRVGEHKENLEVGPVTSSSQQFVLQRRTQILCTTRTTMVPVGLEFALPAFLCPRMQVLANQALFVCLTSSYNIYYEGSNKGRVVQTNKDRGHEFVTDIRGHNQLEE